MLQTHFVLVGFAVPWIQGSSHTGPNQPVWHFIHLGGSYAGSQKPRLLQSGSPGQSGISQPAPEMQDEHW